MLMVPGTVSATGTGVGIGNVSEGMGVTATNTGAASEKEVGVGMGVGSGVGVGIRVGVKTGLTGDTLAIDVAEGNAGQGTFGTALEEADKGSGVDVAPPIAGGGNVGTRVDVTAPDAKLPATDNAPNKAQKATIIRTAMIHFLRVICALSQRR